MKLGGLWNLGCWGVRRFARGVSRGGSEMGDWSGVSSPVSRMASFKSSPSSANTGSGSPSLSREIDMPPSLGPLSSKSPVPLSPSPSKTLPPMPPWSSEAGTGGELSISSSPLNPDLSPLDGDVDFLNTPSFPDEADTRRLFLSLPSSLPSLPSNPPSESATGEEGDELSMSSVYRGLALEGRKSCVGVGVEGWAGARVFTKRGEALAGVLPWGWKRRTVNFGAGV